MIKVDVAVEKLNEVGIDASVTKTCKNGIEKTGIALGNDSLKPTVYPDDFDDVDVFIDFCRQALKNEKPKFDLDVIGKDVIDYDKVKDKLFVCLINNDKIKDDMVSDTAFEDLSKYLRIYVGENATITVKENLFKEWGVSKEQAFADALENSKKIMPAICEDLNSMFSFHGSEDGALYVVTNEKMYFGAGAILYSDKLPNEFYMLPSSIHETLIIPIDKYSDEESNLADMVRAVNSTEVRPEDKLSDNAYYFNINTGWRTIFRKENRE